MQKHTFDPLPNLHMNKTLYIIGNGFDLHHGLATRYNQFRDFVRSKDKNLIGKIDEYICIDEDWCEFEEALASLDVDRLTDDASSHLHSYSHEDWSDSFHHDFQFEIQETVSALSSKLHNEFCEWINTINPSDAKKELFLNTDALFLTFNYTSTLEDVYEIETSQINHIHGSIGDGDDEIVLGHSWCPEEREQLSELTDEESDIRIIEGYDVVDSYFSSTYKPIDNIIDENQDYFDELSYINDIYVLGHSMADVDMGYFYKVASKLSDDCNWYISYYSDQDKEKLGRSIESLRVNSATFIKIEECA